MSRYDESIDAILDIEINNIVAVKKSLDRNTMEKVIDLLLTVKENSHKVITAGCGTSGTLAERVAHSLCVLICYVRISLSEYRYFTFVVPCVSLLC